MWQLLGSTLQGTSIPPGPKCTFISRGSCGHSDPCREVTEALNQQNTFKRILKHFVDEGET